MASGYNRLTFAAVIFVVLVVLIVLGNSWVSNQIKGLEAPTQQAKTSPAVTVVEVGRVSKPAPVHIDPQNDPLAPIIPRQEQEIKQKPATKPAVESKAKPAASDHEFPLQDPILVQ